MRSLAALGVITLACAPLAACVGRVDVTGVRSESGTLDAGAPSDGGSQIAGGSPIDGGTSGAVTLSIAIVGPPGEVVSEPAGINCYTFSVDAPPSVCEAPFLRGGQVVLTAGTAGFVGWSGGGCENAGTNSCTLVLTADTTVTANFTLWTERQPFPAAVSALALFDGSLVAAGRDGTLFSADWLTWTPVYDAIGTRQLAASDAALVAVGDNGIYAASGIEILGDSVVFPYLYSGMPTNEPLTGVAYGNGLFAAVGAGGTVLTSSNGMNWSAPATPTSAELRAVTMGAGMFAAVGDGVILTSADGVSWSARSVAGEVPSLLAVAYGDSGFVAVGANGALVTSPDGAVWTVAPALTNATLRGVASSGPLYVAAGDALSANGTALAFTSRDGQLWTAHDTGLAQETLLGVAQVAGLFDLLGASGSILSSSTGDTWSVLVTPPGTPSAPLTTLSSLAAGAPGLVAVGDHDAIFSSPAAWGPWTIRYAEGCCARFSSVAFGANSFVAVGSDASGAGTRIIASSDGAEWTQVASLDAGTFTDLAFADSFVAVGTNGDGGTGLVATSLDGLVWSDVSASAALGSVQAVGAGGGLFVATGAGAIYTSPDGTRWTARTSPTAHTIGKVAYGNGVYVGADRTSGAASVTSSDGVNWSLHEQGASGPGDIFFEAPCGNAFFSGAWGESTDGISWSWPGPMPAGFTLLSGACALDEGGFTPATLVGIAPGEVFEYVGAP